MGFFKKLLGTTAVTGAAIASAFYVKKRKENRLTEDNDMDFSDEKMFDFNTDNQDDGKTKVTVTINKRKAKNMADSAADKVIDAADKLKDTVTDKIGEEKVDAIKEKVDMAKDKINDAAAFAKDKAMDAKDIVIEKVGEDNIQYAKDKMMNAANAAKDKALETVGKFVKTADDCSEDDFVDEDNEPVVSAASSQNSAVETEDDVKLDADDDVLENELDEI